MSEFFRKNKLALLKLAFISFILFRVFSFDIFPVTTNDSVGYLSRAVSDELLKNPQDILRVRGYGNAAGYPLYLSIWHHVAERAPIDGLTLMAISQRLLLAMALVALMLELGLLAMPLALYFSSGHFLAHSNMLIAEGMTIPFSIIMAVMTVKLYRRRDDRSYPGSLRFWLAVSVLTITYSFLVLAKLNTVIFGLPLFAVAFTLSRDSFRPKIALTRIWLPISIILLMAFSFVVHISADNYGVFGQFTPIFGKERFYFYGAWQQVFTEHPENRSRPELATHYGEGSPYTTIHGIEEEAGGYGEYEKTLPLLSAARSDLLNKSGLSVPREIMRTFGFGMLGGGKNELQSFRRRLLASGSLETDYDRAWLDNHWTRSNGVDAFLSRLNRGAEPRIVPGLLRRPMPVGNTYRFVQAIMAFLAISATIVLIGLGKLGKASLSSLALLAYMILIATMANAFVDIWRYIVPGWIFLMIILFDGFIDLLRKTKNDTLRSLI